MTRIPKLLSVLLLLAAAAASVGISILAGPTPVRELTQDIVLQYRLPRGLLGLLAGASLGISGVCFQGLFRNALADPFVVGVSGGAALGAVGMISLGLEKSVLGLAPTTLAAFGGGLGAAFLAYQMARVRGRVPVSALLLAGSAIGSFSGALVTILLLFTTPNWSAAISWLMGNLGRPDPWHRIHVVLPCLVASGAVMAFYARDLNLLLLGEEQARQLGVESERVKLVLLGAGALAAAGAVSVCGMIGFVGLIVPHIARRFVGPDHGTLLPVALLAGGVLLTLADVAARAVSSMPLPIGAVTALAGAPFFIYILRTKALR